MQRFSLEILPGNLLNGVGEGWGGGGRHGSCSPGAAVSLRQLWTRPPWGHGDILSAPDASGSTEPEKNVTNVS